MTLKQKILALRKKRYSYRQIQRELSCSKSTISFHCSHLSQKNTSQRLKKWRGDHPLRRKIQRFNDTGQSKITKKEVEEKIGDNPICYLTGRSIDLQDRASYSLDHIIPRSRGGNNTIENMGITCREANQSKWNMTVEEFLALCKEVLEYNGYEVKKND